MKDWTEMTIRHHLSDQLLMAYAAGQLPEAFNLVVATHVSLCDEKSIPMPGSFEVSWETAVRCYNKNKPVIC